MVLSETASHFWKALPCRLPVPADLDIRTLRSRLEVLWIGSICGRVTVEPAGAFHLHRGPAYPAEFLAAVSNPLAISPIQPGATVVDLGAGLAWTCCRRPVVPEGHAIGVAVASGIGTVASPLRLNLDDGGRADKLPPRAAPVTLDHRELDRTVACMTRCHRYSTERHSDAVSFCGLLALVLGNQPKLLAQM
jgi:hypothetical protein